MISEKGDRRGDRFWIFLTRGVGGSQFQILPYKGECEVCKSQFLADIIYVNSLLGLLLAF